MAFTKKTWANGNDVLPDDLNRYETALDEHETELVDKIDKTQIKNTLTETSTGNVLDSTQGKAINDKITATTASILAINNRLQMNTYATLASLDLTDAQFTGLTQVQAFDLLLTKLGRQKILYFRTDSSFVNFRTAIGSSIYGTLLKVEVYAFERYVATVYSADSATNVTATCMGFLTFSSPWKTVATIEDINERGYFDSIFLDSVNFNTVITNGKFRISNGTMKPDASTSSTFVLDVTAMNGVYLVQRAFCIYSNIGNTGKSYERSCNNGVWTPWQEIARISKSDITLLNGWGAWGGIYTLKANRVGTTVTISGTMENGTITTGTSLFILPVGFRPLRQECLPALSSDNKVMNLLLQQGGTAVIDNSFGVVWTSARKLVNFSYECA